MSDSVFQDAHLIGVYVARKIAKLQASFLSSGSGSAAARASLARLRRLDQPSGGVWAAAGSELFQGLPDMGASRKDEERMLKAVKSALKLYAYHQQSKSMPMALIKPDDEDEGTVRRRSFGWSCRAIEFDLEESSGVVRRMAALESARDISGIVNGLRSLIQLMRANDMPVDYYQLARDLYLLQFDGCRSEVFMRWSRDYYRSYSKQKNSEVQDDKGSNGEES